MFMPALKRVIRLSEKSRREPFLGSTFYVVDLVEPVLDDFRYAFVGERTVNGTACRLVESVPKDPAKHLYGKTVAAIDPVELVVWQSELYDQERAPFKILTVEKFEKIDGHWTPRVQRMKDLRDGEVSILDLQEIEYDAPLLDETFELAHLLR